MTTRFDSVHRKIESWFRESLTVVEPRQAVKHAMTWDGSSLKVDGHRVEIVPDAQVLVIAIGKAASAMALGAQEVLGDRIDRGLVLTKEGHPGEDIPGFEHFEASHPVPDQRAVLATDRILRSVEGLSGDDLVIALISGGGSALLESPHEPVTLEDMQETTRTLMHAGAGIQDLNAVRSVLSAVKAGGLRRQIGEARCVSLLLSDVLGNDPEVIASGPTIRGVPSSARASQVLQRFNLWESVPERVRVLLAQDEESSEPEVAGDEDVWSIIADNEALVREMQQRIEADGLRSRLQWDSYEGDAAELGRLMVRDSRDAAANIDVLLGGGEATVQVAGEGVGGRNTEAALAAAIDLGPADDWVFASLASDGDDGSAHAAGAIANPGTVGRGQDAGVDAVASLRENDSATFFRSAGGLVVTGPTGTNVNDVYVAVRVSALKAKE